MDIHGLQKLTLLDFPGRVACTVFLQGCDLRCPFCHNGGLVLGGMEPVTDDAGLLDFLKKRRGLLDGVAITGGEPLLRRELPALLRSIKELGYAVKLDTNGSHPEALRAVVATGLVDYVAMDIKNSPAKYAATVGLPGFDLTPVRQSAALCWRARWTTSSVPRRWRSCMTTIPSGRSPNGSPVRSGTTSSALSTGTPCCGQGFTHRTRHSWSAGRISCGR